MKKLIYTDGEFVLGDRPRVMGIVNVTPDSFSDGGMYFSPEKAAKHAFMLEEQGADIIDFGAMSTRPGSEEITPEEEIERLKPVLELVSGKLKAVISVDTVNANTAEFSLENGAEIINDVSGVFSNEMASVVKKYHAGWIVTHTGGVPSGTVLNYSDGVIASVNSFFDEMIEKCKLSGIDREYMCLDPGFGFAKTTDDNVKLLGNIEKLIRNDVPFMTALSRKRFIGEITGVEKASDRLTGTLAADLIAVQAGSDFLRVHDVKETVQTLMVYNKIRQERN